VGGKRKAKPLNVSRKRAKLDPSLISTELSLQTMNEFKAYLTYIQKLDQIKEKPMTKKDLDLYQASIRENKVN
jgi:hypothetical protein